MADKIESQEDFESTPAGQYKRWKEEMDASAKMLEKFQKKGRDTVKRYTDERGSGEENETHLNLFWSNVSVYKSMLFGALPKVDVARQHADAPDDIARIASEIMQRVLTLDVEENGSEYSSVLKSVLEDRLIPGLGVARVRYEFESEKQQVPAQMDPQTGIELAPAYENEVTTYEAAPIDYYFWEDVRWSWTRNWKELRWVAFRNYLTKDECIARFGEEVGKDLKYEARKPTEETSSKDDSTDIWEKAEIWEIWDKTHGNQVFWCDGYDKVIETKPDPLKLKGFFPSPPFLMANTTTTMMVPTPDYCFAQDQYKQIDELETRINVLTEAVKVVGFYDQSNDEIKEALNAGVENRMIPVRNWANLSEKGGITNQIDWIPLDKVAEAIAQLTQQRDDKIRLLYNVIGMADIMRGQGSAPGSRVTAEEQSLAASFGSVRVQSLEQEMTSFATDLMQLKCEVVARHFDPLNILKLSNMKFTYEQQPQVTAALQLISNPDEFYIRVSVKPVSQVDFAKMQQERGGFIEKSSVFLQSLGPMIEKAPETLPLWMNIFKWAVAAFPGSDEIEGVLDQAIDQMTAKVQQQLQNPQPDPEQVKAEAAMKLDQQKHQGEMEKITTKHQQDMQAQQAEFQTAMQTQQAEFKADMELIMAKFRTSVKLEEMQGAADIQATTVEAQSDMQLEQQEHDDATELALLTHELDMELVEEQGEVQRAAMEARPDHAGTD